MAAEAVAEPVVPRNGNLLGEMDRAAAAGGVPTPKKLAADGQAGFDTDYAEMARQQAAKWATMDHTVRQSPQSPLSTMMMPVLPLALLRLLRLLLPVSPVLLLSVVPALLDLAVLAVPVVPARYSHHGM